jgi:cytosine/adenosine deaminase-related metal-dependent hydrolase
MPGLVNAHTHLELSWLRGRVPPAGDGMVGWVRRMLAARGAAGRDDPAGIAAGVAEARTAGTALVGDVTNSLATAPLVKAAGLSAVIFHELLGFNPVDPDTYVARAMSAARAVDSQRVKGTIAPHAPYSVSPDLFRAIKRCADAHQRLTTVHAGESVEEMEFLRTGGGPWRVFLEEAGAWTDRWTPPGCGPIEYLERLGVLDSWTLIVHAVHLDDEELARVVAHGATIVTCPRSNAWIGVGAPPIERFYASGARVAIGTDSLASAPDLNLFAELAALRRLAPSVAASRLLESATRVGAEALRLRGRGILGLFTRDVIAIDTPDGVADVEEYLVSGIDPSRIRWIDDAGRQ